MTSMQSVSNPCGFSSLYSRISSGCEEEIDYATFLHYMQLSKKTDRNINISGLAISHVYTPNQCSHSRTTYFYEKEFQGEWRYFARLASGFHVFVANQNSSSRACSLRLSVREARKGVDIETS